jgi:nucleoside-diphosphate-sugar epimerase
LKNRFSVFIISSFNATCFQMKKVFVTGANGFVGSHLVPLLIKNGYDVHCLVRYTSDVSSLRSLPVSIHVGDLRQPETLAEPVKDAVYIFHLAAVLLGLSEEDFMQNNLRGTENLLAAAQSHAGSTLQRFVFVSSLASMGPNAEPVPHVETDEARPMSWYGRSKKEAEAVVRKFGTTLPVTIVRPAIVYGEREQDLSQIFPLVESRIQPKLGLGKKGMVAVYVGDLAEGILAAAESNNTVGKTYFLNHADTITSKQIVKSIGLAMNKGAGLTLGVPDFLIKASAPFAELAHRFNYGRPKMTKDKAREVTQAYWLASPRQAENDFGWVARHNLVDGLRKTLVPYFAEKRVLKEMALENKNVLWLKYFLVALLLGVVVETAAYFGGFYRFYPWWVVLLVIVVAFGAIFATLAKALRRSPGIVQFLVGTAAAGIIESLNTLGAFMPYHWVFKEGWPLGITDPWLRTVVLSFPGGIFILLLNFILRNNYKNRLKKLGDL